MCFLLLNGGWLNLVEGLQNVEVLEGEVGVFVQGVVAVTVQLRQDHGIQVAVDQKDRLLAGGGLSSSFSTTMSK